MKAKQDLNAQIDAAVASYGSNPRRLRRLTRQLRHPDTRKPCRQCAKQLLKREPESMEAIASLFFSYAGGQSRTQLRTALDRAHQRSEGIKRLDKILTKVRSNLNADECSALDELLQNYNNEAAEIARRRPINLQAQQRPLKRTDVETNSCDVIAIAANEGLHRRIRSPLPLPGIQQSVHRTEQRQLRQTGLIIAAIAQHYPQVHLINTDQEHQQERQRGSYCTLYYAASKITKASHCMVVDVDESWVAYPFSSSIKDFLAAHPKADVISSNWLHCHGANLFDNPLDLSNTRLRLTDQFKSVFRYGIPVTDLGCHVPSIAAEPEIRHTSSDGKRLRSTPVNGLRRLSKGGLQASIHKENTGWVIHRHTRSELEYAGKVLYPYANKLKQFKPNRKGYLLPKESNESRQLASNLLGPTHQPPQAYLDSLEAFIDRCGIRELIAAARAEIGEEPIKRRIKAMHPDVISNNRSIWQRTFRGTRFLKLLEQRSRKSRLDNDA